MLCLAKGQKSLIFPTLFMVHTPPLILVADDDPDFKEILSAKLLAEGFKVAEADNGTQAISKAKSLLPDVVIMDIQMPELNGTEAVIELHNNPETQHLNIVFFSSTVHPWPGIASDNAETAKELGAVTFIKKDEDLAVIVKMVKDLIAKSK